MSGPAVKILRAQPRVAGVDFVFHEAGKPLTSFSRAKARLDALVPDGTQPFRIHD